MKLIVGLGNPGEEYVPSRHNMGRRLIEFIASKEQSVFKTQRKYQVSLASISWGGQSVYLARLLTYMNSSGEVVEKLVAYLNITKLQNLLVVVDDVALPFGKFRLRGEGSSGGHNGLLSIEQELGTPDYPRLRIGVGIPDHKNPSKSSGLDEPLKDYVLSAFNAEEEKRMEVVLDQGFNACRSWVLKPLAQAMNQVNSTES